MRRCWLFQLEIWVPLPVWHTHITCRYLDSFLFYFTLPPIIYFFPLASRKQNLYVRKQRWFIKLHVTAFLSLAVTAFLSLVACSDCVTALWIEIRKLLLNKAVLRHPLIREITSGKLGATVIAVRQLYAPENMLITTCGKLHP